MARPDVHTLTGGGGLIAMLAWLTTCALGLGQPAVNGPSDRPGHVGSPMGLTPDQLRNAFIHSGYAVDQPLIWSWLSPPLTSFHAYDQRLGRMLLVQVYPDQAPTVLLPRLVPGYGPPVWFQNVALAEASNVELARLTDCLQAGG